MGTIKLRKWDSAEHLKSDIEDHFSFESMTYGLNLVEVILSPSTQGESLEKKVPKAADSPPFFRGR